MPCKSTLKPRNCWVPFLPEPKPNVDGLKARCLGGDKCKQQQKTNNKKQETRNKKQETRNDNNNNNNNNWRNEQYMVGNDD